MISNPIPVRQRGLRALALLLSSLVLQACATNVADKIDKRRDAAQFNAQLGAQYLQRGDLDQARDKLEKALEQNENNALAQASYGKLLQRIDKPAQARRHFQRAIALEPDEAGHYNSYGIFLCEAGNVDAALDHFRKAAGNPYYDTPEFALDNGGLCLLDAGREQEAGEWLREAVRVNPQFARAYLHMGDLMYRQQRLTIADAYLQRFHTHASETAESLLLGLQIKRDSGDTEGAQELASELLNRFPSSSEAAEYLVRPVGR